VVSHHLGGFLLLDRAGLLHPAADPGVHHVSAGRETSIPAVPVLPSEALLPAGSDASLAPREVSPAKDVEPWGPRHRPRSLEPVRSPRALALLAFPSPAAETVTRLDRADELGLQGLAPPSGPEPTPPRERRCGPDAPMGLADASSPDRPPGACTPHGRDRRAPTVTP
jgi:hypothetical protein